MRTAQNPPDEGPVPPRYLSPKMAEVYTGIDFKTLDFMRRKGTGPKFAKIGKKIVIYDITDLDAFIAARKVTNTAEAKDLAEQGVSLV